MRSISALVLGLILGVMFSVATLMVAGGWYEYHIAVRENPLTMVNDQGWELVSYQHNPDGPDVWYLRRPRLRLH